MQHIIRAAFLDELEKIAGEMHGATRIGRKPIGVDRYLERETDPEYTPSSIFTTEYPAHLKQSSAGQVASEAARRVPAGTGKTLGLMAAGGGIYHFGRQAKKDYDMGRMVRRQQEVGGY